MVGYSLFFFHSWCTLALQLHHFSSYNDIKEEKEKMCLCLFQLKKKIFISVCLLDRQEVFWLQSMIVVPH